MASANPRTASILKRRPRAANSEAIGKEKRRKRALTCPASVNGYRVYEEEELQAVIESAEFQYAIKLWKALNSQQRAECKWSTVKDVAVDGRYREWIGSLFAYVRFAGRRKPKAVAVASLTINGAYSYGDYERSQASKPLRYLNFQAGQHLFYGPNEKTYAHPTQPWNATEKDRQCVCLLSSPSAGDTAMQRFRGNPIFDKLLLREVFQFL